MSAQELRKAAETLRERANAARKYAPEPWTTVDPDPADCGDCCPRGDLFDAGGDAIAAAWTLDRRQGDYIATMHPGVGLALADWLDDEARAAGYHENRVIPSALTIARLINGGAA